VVDENGESEWEEEMNIDQKACENAWMDILDNLVGDILPTSEEMAEEMQEGDGQGYAIPKMKEKDKGEECSEGIDWRLSVD
jgi:hypothetical protein